MDKGKNSVLTYLNMLSHNHALTTAQLADSLNLSRSVVSHYLNELFREEKIQKISGRPVKWTKKGSNPNLNHNFDDFIGYRGSMRYAIDQISAAIMYPPDGLNILITGHSGVGKSYLASKIAQLAKSKGIIGKAVPYIVLNCADYANNPELVSSMLFGYVKGGLYRG